MSIDPITTGTDTENQAGCSRSCLNPRVLIHHPSRTTPRKTMVMNIEGPHKKRRCRCRRRLRPIAAIAAVLGCSVAAFSSTQHVQAFSGDSGRVSFLQRHQVGSTAPLVRLFEAGRDIDAGAEQTMTDDPPKAEKRTKKKLSRPERKALERLKKQEQKEQQNRRPRKNAQASEPAEVVQLTQESTPDDIYRAIKRAEDRRDIKVLGDFLLRQTDEGFAKGERGSLLSRLAVAALHMKEHAVARQAIEARRMHHRSEMLPMASAAILRGLMRVGNVTQALEVLDEELPLPLDGHDVSEPAHRDMIKHRAASLASIASYHFFEQEMTKAVGACQLMAKMGPIVREAGFASEDLDVSWKRIITGAAKCESARRAGDIAVPADDDTEEDEAALPCNLVYAVMGAMATFPSSNDDEIYEVLSNALVRRVLFVTGAVEMSGCPKADRGEAVFIGRSNVGKSSLVNMVTNRKSLAYTSKRPGKTQQFNFFAVNDKPGREKEIRYGDVMIGEKDPDSFYIVDLPGFGFAKVPDYQREMWASFMSDYLSTRRTLKVVFHLVDARHGLIDEDTTIMQQVATSLPKNVAYVVVLTKADKNVKKSSKHKPGKVSADILTSVRETMKRCKVGNSPIILTSAETKLGRDDIWRYLKLAAEG